MTQTLGLCSRTGSAAAVAVDGVAFIGRWVLDLTQERVPAQVYHVAADLPLAEAETFVRGAIDAVTDIAAHRLRELLAEVGFGDAIGVVVGDHPAPESISTILRSHTQMHAAEGQLYRDALLNAAALVGASAIGLPRAQATHRLSGDLAGTVRALGAAAGPPWRKEHKLAAVAALVAGGSNPNAAITDS